MRRPPWLWNFREGSSIAQLWMRKSCEFEMVEEQKLTSCLCGSGLGRVTRCHAVTNCRVGAELMSSSECSSSLFLCWIIPQLLLGSSWAHTSGDDLFIARKMRLLPCRVQTPATFQHPPLDEELKEDLSQLLIFIYIAAGPVVICVTASYILLWVNYFSVQICILYLILRDS